MEIRLHETPKLIADAILGAEGINAHLSASNAAVATKECHAFPGAERQVEFIGPPGVGKSAIYHATLARLGRQGTYRTAQEGWLLAAAASLDRLKPLRRVSYRSAFRLPRFGKEYARRLAATSSEDSFRQTLSVHGPFVDCCMEMARTGFGDAFARLARLSIILEQLRDLHLWSRLPAAVRILQQDALIQKGWTCARQSRAAFFSLVPKPSAVVLVVAPPDLIVERLRARERRISAHVGLSNAELHAVTTDAGEAFRFAAEVLRRRTVPVLEVDGQMQPSEAAEHVAGFLRNGIPG